MNLMNLIFYKMIDQLNIRYSTRGSSPTEEDWAVAWDLTINGPVVPAEHGTRAWWRECCFF